MNNKIRYIGYYDISSNANENRNYSLAASNKMKYIADTLLSMGYKVKIVSNSRTKDKSYYKGKILNEGNIEIKQFSTLPWGNKFQKMASIVYSNIQLLSYLLLNTRANETVMVYHSLGYGMVIILAKKIKRFNLLLEVEEIYQDVVECSKYKKTIENYMFEIADKFIFPTNLLDDRINNSGKPSIIIHGTYKVEKERNIRFNDKKTHIVYAGTFEQKKGGAIAAAAAEFLPEDYHIHIIGFGTPEQVETIKSVINKVNIKSKSTVTYDGLLTGEEYIAFLQKCDVGLSTQDPRASYNDTSFPSKILSYMANGLRVVTVRIKAIEESSIGQDVYYFEEYNPEEIAVAIKEIDFNEYYDSRALIKNLDDLFKKNIRKIM